MEAAQSSERLLAFQIGSEEGPAEVVFAADEESALQGYRGTSEEEVEVARLPEFDRHAPGPVPRSVLLENGWSLDSKELGPEVVAFIRAQELSKAGAR